MDPALCIYLLNSLHADVQSDIFVSCDLALCFIGHFINIYFLSSLLCDSCSCIVLREVFFYFHKYRIWNDLLCIVVDLFISVSLFN